MNPKRLACMLAAGFTSAFLGSTAVWPDEPPKPTASLPSVAEARQRARLLHGTIHDTLQVVHARYFREGERLAIPAAALQDVFKQLEEREGIKLRWLVVEGRPMNIDHEPRDAFEKEAARLLASGRPEHELATPDLYRHAGPITLRAECLKCHLPSRSDNKPRTAGLLISVPVGRP